MDFQALEAERLKVYGTYKKLMIIGGCTAIIIIGLIILAVGFAKKRGFEKRIKPDLMKALIEESYPGGQYFPYVNREEYLARVLATGMVKRPDRYSIEDSVEASFNGVQFKAYDVHLEEKKERYNPQTKRTEVTWVTYFKGRWYEFLYEKNFNQTIKIVEKTMFANFGTSGLEKCEVESIDFTKKFNIFASDTQTLFYIVTPVIIEKILELEKMNKGKIMFAYINNKLSIGVNDNQDYLEPSIKRPFTDEGLKEYRSQINIMGAIIDELGLDSQKFKNQE